LRSSPRVDVLGDIVAGQLQPNTCSSSNRHSSRSQPSIGDKSHVRKTTDNSSGGISNPSSQFIALDMCDTANIAVSKGTDPPRHASTTSSRSRELITSCIDSSQRRRYSRGTKRSINVGRGRQDCKRGCSIFSARNIVRPTRQRCEHRQDYTWICPVQLQLSHIHSNGPLADVVGMIGLELLAIRHHLS
jgi:hypothetical protein